MCDKKNSVLFTDTEYLVLSPEFKLPDENQVLLRVLKENNVYNLDLKSIVPSGDLTCLFAKATLDESNLWHRRPSHINFNTMNKLVKVLTKSKLVPITAARLVTAVVPKPHVTRPRQAKPIVTKPHSPPRRNINHSPSPKASIFPPKVTAAKAPMVNAVKGNQHAPSFVQPTEQVKTPRPYVKTLKNSIPAANHKTTIPKPKSNGRRRNRKTCFVCKSLDHLIKD
nr:ribonuclease H-like domain-containing protein [Tanacetum cinerariifolium]